MDRLDRVHIFTTGPCLVSVTIRVSNHLIIRIYVAIINAQAVTSVSQSMPQTIEYDVGKVLRAGKSISDRDIGERYLLPVTCNLIHRRGLDHQLLANVI